MLYTLSAAHYDLTELAVMFAQLSNNDAVVLWQNGVLQAVKNPQFFAKYPNVFVLENDLIARNLTTNLPIISLSELIEISVQFSPQIAL